MSEIITRVRFELVESAPLIWRELDIPLSTTLASLHDLIQVVMRWQDYHLHEFIVGDRIYGVPYPEDASDDRRVFKEKSIRIGTLIERGLREFRYIYDFGDHWRLRIILDDPRQGEAGVEYPRFIAGARRAPPEDVGGISGFEDFLEAMADPEHDYYQQMLDWYGEVFDPEDIEAPWISTIIQHNFAARRRGPLQSHRGDARKKSR